MSELECTRPLEAPWVPEALEARPFPGFEQVVPCSSARPGRSVVAALVTFCGSAIVSVAVLLVLALSTARTDQQRQAERAARLEARARERELIVRQQALLDRLEDAACVAR